MCSMYVFKVYKMVCLLAFAYGRAFVMEKYKIGKGFLEIRSKKCEGIFWRCGRWWYKCGAMHSVFTFCIFTTIFYPHKYVNVFKGAGLVLLLGAYVLFSAGLALTTKIQKHFASILFPPHIFLWPFYTCIYYTFHNIHNFFSRLFKVSKAFLFSIA